MLVNVLIVLGPVVLVITIVFARRALSSRKSTRYFKDITEKDLKLRRESSWFYSKDKGKALPKPRSRTNGKMPALLLSPLRVYVPATLGTVALVAFLFAFLQ